LQYSELTDLMQRISFSVWGLILITVVLFYIRKTVTSRKPVTMQPTWGCGYTAASPSMQYTANSFVRSYTKLIKPLIIMNKTRDEIPDIIPAPILAETHYHDKIETGLIDWPVRNLKGFLRRFKILQNGSVQFYVLYGVVFIAISIAIPLIIFAGQYLIQLLKQL